MHLKHKAKMAKFVLGFQNLQHQLAHGGTGIGGDHNYAYFNKINDRHLKFEKHYNDFIDKKNNFQKNERGNLIYYK